ncbi:ATP-binding protein [Streptomyces sp. NPDC056527]|uniref:ATP-binding protein n=1 Tax=Streptomyces sp. NPDC056527 TaxID=3345853 RepID=UPI0036A4A67D
MLTAIAHLAAGVPAPARAPALAPGGAPGPTPASVSTRAFVRWVPEPTAATVPLVRARVRALLQGWRVAADIADALLLAVSELVGNVVQHAAETGRMRVGVSCGAGWLRLEVADGAVAPPRLPDPDVEVDQDAEGGRGLLLVQLLVAEAGGELAVLVHELGKSVRVRIPLA